MSGSLVTEALIVSGNLGAENLTLSPGAIVLEVAPLLMAPEIPVTSKSQTSGPPFTLGRKFEMQRRL